MVLYQMSMAKLKNQEAAHKIKELKELLGFILNFPKTVLCQLSGVGGVRVIVDTSKCTISDVQQIQIL